MEVFVCIVLAVVCVVLAVRQAMFKRSLRDIRHELELNRKNGYDRQITVTLFDKDLTAAAAEINKSLDFQKKLKNETERRENQLKQSVSDIAHDLRTPIAVIKGNLQLAQAEKLTDDGRRYIDISIKRADSMKRMADEFFELAVLESDSTAAEPAKVDITCALMDFLAENEAVIRNSGLEAEIEFPERSIFVYADRAMLMRMLGNLLNNVLRYASDSFKLKLDDNGTVTFSNAVSGRIPDTESLFLRSYRSGKSADRQNAGLGLYIVRLLAEKQEASVNASAEDGLLSVSIAFRTL